ncbi:MAG: hypothetical protein J6A89_04135 [Clostridia bacterium]|nr:hypothetical protein [Clostridia bacterium]
MMNKEELLKLLKSLKVPVSEGVPDDNNIEAKTRICFWEYVWEPFVASGNEYNTKVTYQVSIISENPRCKALINLKNELNKLDLHPIIQHEKDIQTRRWHSYLAIEVLENIE